MKKKNTGIILGMIVGVFIAIAILVRMKGMADGRRDAKKEEVLRISREDAEALVSQKLSQTSFEWSYDRTDESGGVSYYFFTVMLDEKPTEEMLAVNCVSGEVNTYLPAEDRILPYSDFTGYDAELDDDIEWNGEYTSDKYVISIEEQDPASFEFRISDEQGEKIRGYGAKDSNIEATATLDDVQYKFNLSGRELHFGAVSGSSPYDGTYLGR